MRVDLLANLRQDLESLSENVPIGFEKVLKQQDLLISSLETFNQHNKNGETRPIKGHEEDFLLNESISFNESSDLNNNSLTIDVHIDVVMLGFPKSAIWHAKDDWFNTLVRDEPLRGRLQKHLFDLAGPIKVRNHFHLVEVSPNVTEVLQKKIGQLLLAAAETKAVGANREVLSINAWEIEEVLASLTTTISSSHRDRRHPDHRLGPVLLPLGTIYVFHWDLESAWASATAGSGESVSTQMSAHHQYRYHLGFNEAEMSLLAADKEVLAQCEEVIGTTASTTRLDVDATITSDNRLSREAGPDLVRKLIKVGAEAEAEANTKRSNGTPTQPHVFIRDAVLETTTWAAEWLKVFARPRPTLAQRALRILRGSPEAPIGTEEAAEVYGVLRLPLAKALLSTRMAAMQGVREGHDTSCSASIWVSSRDFIWIDTQAVAQSPQLKGAELSSGDRERRRAAGITTSLSLSANVPQPRPVQLRDWDYLTLSGAVSFAEIQTRIMDVVESLVTGTLRHYNALRRLTLQNTPSSHGQAPLCPETVTSQFHADPGDNAFGSLESLYAQIADQRTSGEIQKEACTTAAQQLGLLSASIATTRALTFSIEEFAARIPTAPEPTNASANADLSDSQASVLAAYNLLKLTLDSVLASSGVLHGTSHTRTIAMGPSATEYLSFVCAAVLTSARELLSPPMAMHETSSPITISTPALNIANPQTQIDLSRQTLLDIVLGSESTRVKPSNNVANDDKRQNADNDARADVARWDGLFPPLSFPSRIAVEVYVLKMHQKYNPFPSTDYAEDGLDYRLLELGLSQLRLGNQDLSITVHLLDQRSFARFGSSSESIELAVASCLRYAIYGNVRLQQGNENNATDAVSPRQQQYIDAACVWKHLMRFDAERAALSSSGTQHVPVFILSMDEELPTFASATLSLTAIVDGGVLAVQNRQLHIDTGLTCGEQRVLLKGRDPSGAILVAVGTIVAGIAPKLYEPCASVATELAQGHTLHIRTATDSQNNIYPLADTQEATTYYGSSPTFQSQSVADLASVTFTSLEIQSALRSRALRLLGATYALIKKKLVDVHDQQQRQQRSNGESAASKQPRPSAHALARALIQMLHGLRALVEQSTETRMGWEMTSAAANAAYNCAMEWVVSDHLDEHLQWAAEASIPSEVKSAQNRFYFNDKAASSSILGSKTSNSMFSLNALSAPVLVAILTFACTYLDTWSWAGRVFSAAVAKTAARRANKHPSFKAREEVESTMSQSDDYTNRKNFL
jgi:hypothetical protein